MAAAVCLCDFICPTRSGDFGLVLLALRNAPSESFCLMGLSKCIWISYFFSVSYRYIYLSTLFTNVVSLVELGVHIFSDFKSQDGKKPGYSFRVGTGRRTVILKEAELFSEFPYPLPPQQSTLFFLQ